MLKRKRHISMSGCACMMALAIAACSGSGDAVAKPPTTSSPSGNTVTSTSGLTSSTTVPSVFTLAVDSVTRSGNKAIVAGTTNLPDGASIGVALHRLEQDYGESELRIGTAAVGSNVVVREGRWQTEIEVTDIALKFADSSSAPQIVSDHIIACAIFESDPGMGDPQKNNVRQIVGPEGERLATSPDAKLVGQATTTPSYWLTAESELFWPSEMIGVVMANTGRTVTQSHISSIGCF